MAKLIGRHPCEQNGKMGEAGECGNPFEKGRPVYIATRQQLAEWLNMLAKHVSINRSESNPNGYFATEHNIG